MELRSATSNSFHITTMNTCCASSRDLLDQQIIDVTGRKVVRVNDVTFEIHHSDRDTLTVAG